MLNYVDHKNLGHANHGWLNSIHHFSFASYHNPERMGFGVLRVVNDDIVDAGQGFATHPHQNMEIISYVLEGELSHKDSMGNEGTLKRGEIQYMSAGTGIYHSEYNKGSQPLHFCQLWILPHTQGLKPNYGDLRLPWQDRMDKWMPIASGSNEARFPIRIYSDLNLYACYLQSGKEIEFKVEHGRQAYLLLMEGEAVVNGIALHAKDALEVVEEGLTIKASKNAHMLMFEMKKASI